MSSMFRVSFYTIGFVHLSVSQQVKKPIQTGDLRLIHFTHMHSYRNCWKYTRYIEPLQPISGTNILHYYPESLYHLHTQMV